MPIAVRYADKIISNISNSYFFSCPICLTCIKPVSHCPILMSVMLLKLRAFVCSDSNRFFVPTARPIARDFVLFNP